MPLSVEDTVDGLLQDARAIGETGSTLILHTAFICILAVYLANGNQEQRENFDDCENRGIGNSSRPYP